MPELEPDKKVIESELAKTLKLKIHTFIRRSDEDFQQWENLRSDFINRLRAKYEFDCEKYRLYHLLLGGGDARECESFDFPDEDSIE